MKYICNVCTTPCTLDTGGEVNKAGEDGVCPLEYDEAEWEAIEYYGDKPCLNI